MGIPSGKDFINYIKGQIQKPKAVIAIISPNYHNSEFCLCELGAAWAMTHNMLPLLVPPTKYKDLGGVLTVTQAIPIDDHSKLTELADELMKQLGAVIPNTARWNKKSEKFISGLPEVLGLISFPDKVTEKQFKTTQKELKEAKQYVDELDSEIEKLKEMVEELSACKDAEEVDAVKVAHSDQSEPDEFMELVDTASRAADQFCGEIKRVLVFARLGMVYSRDWNYYREEYEHAIRQKLFEDEETLTPNEHNRHVTKLFDALDKLSVFLEEPSDAFSDWFYEEYECDLEIDNSEFLSEMSII
jgi:hypothetical protein